MGPVVDAPSPPLLLSSTDVSRSAAFEVLALELTLFAGAGDRKSGGRWADAASNARKPLTNIKSTGRRFRRVWASAPALGL
jgi:hypothetical protein